MRAGGLLHISCSEAQQLRIVCSAGDGSIPELGRCPGEGHGNPLQYSCLDNPMDVGAWQAAVHGGCKESDMTEHRHIL